MGNLTGQMIGNQQKKFIFAPDCTKPISIN